MIAQFSFDLYHIKNDSRLNTKAYKEITCEIPEEDGWPVRPVAAGQQGLSRQIHLHRGGEVSLPEKGARYMTS